MPKIGFADESGTDSKSPCYAIGVLLLDVNRLSAFEGVLQGLRVTHGISHELKWKRISNSHGAINFLLEALDLILKSTTVTFDVIVVRKTLFRNWQGDAIQQEKAFYQTYTFLLRHVLNRVRDAAEVVIDDRSDSYGKQHEVIETIGNRMLAKLESSGRLDAVRKVNSKESPGIQVADLLTGVVTAAHNVYLKPETQMHAGKRLAIERVAQMLGWDRLCYDTYPHPRFNVWHFPIEFRADPASRDPAPTGSIPYVLPSEVVSGRG